MKLKLPTIEDIRCAYREGEDAVVVQFMQVLTQVSTVAARVEKQMEIILALEARLGKDSRTSSKPPFSDGYGKAPAESKRTESLCKAGQKPKGGQPGHEGKTLKQTAYPEYGETHTPETCRQCGTGLEGIVASGCEERQVFDIPAMHIEVTAHRALQVICPTCGELTRGEFSAKVTASVQYGNGVKALSGYPTRQHHLPLARTTEIIEDLFGHHISEAVVDSSSHSLAGAIKPSEEVVKAPLVNSEILHVDESGMRVEGKLHWSHVASTDKLARYSIHAKRGKLAMDDAGILPLFKWQLIHDHWKTYFGYGDCRHRLCNVHHLRELLGVEKFWQQSWAGEMSTLLCEIPQATTTARQQAENCLPDAMKADFYRRYDCLLKAGHAANPPRALDPNVEWQPKKRGHTAQSIPRNLLNRLDNFKPEVLVFMEDFRVPFSNNQAERDVRMVNLKQKVSGGFRTITGAENFASIRGYLSTARKNGKNILSAIKDALAGNPFTPNPA